MRLQKHLCLSILSVWLTFFCIPAQMHPASQAAQTDAEVQATKGKSAGPPPSSQQSASSPGWQTAAWLHHGLRKTSGTLTINGAGLDFRPEKGSSIRWAFADIQTLYLLPRQITVTGYKQRGKILPERLVRRKVTFPGDKRFQFDLGSNLPPTLAAELAKSVGRPVRNGDPEPEFPSSAEIPARHRAALGGTISNGILRILDGGVEYLSKSPEDSRNWCWVDIQEITHQDPYHLIVFAYRETYSFDLKEPLQQKTYDRLTDEVYRHHQEVGGATGTDNQGKSE